MLYDTIIIGAGPAGLTASIYASRYKLSNLVIGKIVGGTITHAHKVNNFPGIPDISGIELGQRMAKQAKTLGAAIVVEDVEKIETVSAEVGKSFFCNRQTSSNSKSEDGEQAENPGSVCSARIGEDKDNKDFTNFIFKVTTDAKKEFWASTLIVALGTERRKLGVPGEREYLGKGVSYCVTCDAPFYKGKKVVLVGGSNAACSGAIHLANFAEKIYLVYRRDELRAEPVWVEEVKKNPKIEVIYNTNITEILGDGTRVTGVKLDTPYENNLTLFANGVFVEIGGQPSSSLLQPLGVEVDENNYIKVDERMKTNISGVFAAGDVTDKSLVLSQVITACAQGAIAANSAFEYLKGKN